MASYYSLGGGRYDQACTSALERGRTTTTIAFGMEGKRRWGKAVLKEANRLPFTRGILESTKDITSINREGYSRGHGKTYDLSGMDLNKIHHLITLMRAPSERSVLLDETLTPEGKEGIEKYGPGYSFLYSDFVCQTGHSLWMFMYWGVEKTLKLFLYPDKYYENNRPYIIGVDGPCTWIRNKSNNIMSMEENRHWRCLYSLDRSHKTLLKLLEDNHE